MSIPKRFIRSVPAETSDEVEGFWARLRELHPGWQFDTYRDPIDPTDFPLTSPHWHKCTSGAQLAGLIRLEALWSGGGIWVDSDFEPYRSFSSLLELDAFAAYEDRNVIPDAVLGFRKNHLLLTTMIGEAIRELPRGAWASGPGITTRFLPNRTDVTILPPGAFYPMHYKIKRRYDSTTSRGRENLARLPEEQPWAFGAHRWHHSWAGA